MTTTDGPTLDDPPLSARDRADERVAELVRANDALQSVADALATAHGLDEIVPTVLRIAAHTLGVASAGFYDVSDDSFVRLRYWLHDGQVYNPAGLQVLDPLGRHAVPRRLADGFRVSLAYLGGETAVGRTRATVVDHAAGTGEPDFDAWTRQFGLEMELNVPCVSGGRAHGALVLMRVRTHRYTDTETELAEALAMQLALAVQADRLATEAREAAVARERVAATERRAGELEKANDVLRAVNARLAVETDVSAIFGHVLAEACSVLGAVDGCLTLLGDDGCLRLAAAVYDGRPSPTLPGHPFGTGEPFRLEQFPGWRPMADLRGRPLVMALPDDAVLADATAVWHRGRGHAGIVLEALMLGDAPVGLLGLAYGEGRTFTPEQLGFLQALGQQAALAVRAARMADDAREAAVAREREASAERRAAELAQANDALHLRDRLLTAVADALKGLLGSDDFETAVPDALRVLGEAAGIDRVKVILGRPAPAGGRPYHELVYEWWAPGLSSQASHGITHFDDEVIAEYIAPCRAGQALWHFIDQVPSELREPFERVGMRSMGVVPVFVGRVFAGFVTFDDCAERRAWTQAEMDALTVAGRAIGAAIHQRELGREKVEAVVREREAAAERRAAELGRANDTLKRCADGAAHAGADPSAVLGRVLAALSEHLRSSSAALWTEDGGRSDLHLVYLDGQVIPAGPDTDARLAGHWSRGRGLAFRRHVDERRPVVYGPDDIAGLPAVGQQFFDRLGIRSLLGVPLVSGDAVIGSLTSRFPDVREFDRDDLELVQAVAHQATLALELTRLADQAKVTAVAREREAAAERRAAELGRANNALQAATDALAAGEGAEPLVPAVLRVAAAAFGATSATYYEHLDDETARLLYWMRHGRMLAPDDITPDGTELMDVVSALTRGFPAPPAYRDQPLSGRRKPMAVDHVRGSGHPQFDRLAVAHGWGQELHVPLVVDGRADGALVISREAPYTPDEVSLAETLGKQMALALRLHRLADARRDAAVAGERNRLAGEIHDTLAQGFAGVLTQLAAAEGALAAGQDAARGHIARARDLARLNLTEARRSVHALRPLPLAARDLPAALAALGRRRGETPVRVTVSGSPRPLPPAVEGELYRVAQEAVANADRHAAARRIDIALAFDPDQVLLAVRDDGRGFDPAAVPAGHGLVGMQERMDRAGGSVTIVSEPGRGTEVVAVVPTAAGGDRHD